MALVPDIVFPSEIIYKANSSLNSQKLVKSSYQHPLDDLAHAFIQAKASESATALVLSAAHEESVDYGVKKSNQVWEHASNVVEELTPSSRFFCGSCYSKLDNNLSTCQNQKCIVFNTSSGPLVYIPLSSQHPTRSIPPVPRQQGVSDFMNAPTNSRTRQYAPIPIQPLHNNVPKLSTFRKPFSPMHPAPIMAITHATPCGNVVPSLPKVSTGRSNSISTPVVQAVNNVAGAPHKDKSSVKLIVDVLSRMEKESLSLADIEGIIENHRDKPSFDNEYDETIEYLSTKNLKLKAGGRGSYGTTLMFNVLERRESLKDEEKRTFKEVFANIDRPLPIDWTYKVALPKMGPLWSNGILNLANNNKFPSDGYKSISACIRFVILELFADPNDAHFFTFNHLNGPATKFLEFPHSVNRLIEEIMFGAAKFPRKILYDDYTPNRLREDSPKLYVALGDDESQRSEGYNNLLKSALNFRTFWRKKGSRLCADWRTCYVWRENGRVIQRKLTEPEKKERNDKFEDRKQQILETLKNS